MRWEGELSEIRGAMRKIKSTFLLFFPTLPSKLHTSQQNKNKNTGKTFIVFLFRNHKNRRERNFYLFHAFVGIK